MKKEEEKVPKRSPMGKSDKFKPDLTMQVKSDAKNDNINYFS